MTINYGEGLDSGKYLYIVSGLLRRGRGDLACWDRRAVGLRYYFSCYVRSIVLQV